jgi:transposase
MVNCRAEAKHTMISPPIPSKASAMRVFPTAGHLASWAGLCPGNNESAGKHRSGKARKGNRWLRSALTEAALASTRASHTAFAARYRRIMPHRGHKKAVVAVAHALLTTVYHLLARQTSYRELGTDYYDRRHAERVRNRAIHTLERQQSVGRHVFMRPDGGDGWRWLSEP